MEMSPGEAPGLMMPRLISFSTGPPVVSVMMPEPWIVPVLSRSLLLLLMMPFGPRSIRPALFVMTLKVSAPPVLRIVAPVALLTRLRMIASPTSDSISA